jgi:putative hydrolase of the HAD superfamily
MRLTYALLLLWSTESEAFGVRSGPGHTFATTVASAADSVDFSGGLAPENHLVRRDLALITFDLDDTLFPIGPVVDEANVAMIEAITKLVGYPSSITSETVIETTKNIRRELDSPITYTDLRKLAIRAELLKYLDADALDDSVVHHVFEAWLLERHASAERHLFEGAQQVLTHLREQFPSLQIGAITNGRGNPLDMKGSALPSLFDFCISGEDEGVFPNRKPHKGIYEAALERVNLSLTEGSSETCWIHVGDDLANDVGASAACGAKTIWLDTNDDLKSSNAPLPSWSTIGEEERETRRKLAEAAFTFVDVRIESLVDLPNAVNRILS